MNPTLSLYGSPNPSSSTAPLLSESSSEKSSTMKSSGDVNQLSPRLPIEERVANFMKKPNFYLCINVLIVPVLFILLSSFSKKISRRSGGFQRQDFFLGSDLVLAATSVGLASITENGADRNAVFMFMLVCIFALFNVISFHQEKQTGDRKTELFWLVGFCNLIGMIPMIGYLLFLKI